ncbi:MAG: transporter [Alphaproteobacteria bacterium]|nr:transporter [Alphaproteobacteria bacterium]
MRIVLAGLALLLFAASARAEDARVEVLQRQLRERDKVMLELLRRVETLEKQIGVPRATRDTADDGKAVAVNKAAPAPGTVIVTERMAERALERSLSREGALLLPSGVLEVEPSFTFVRQEDATSSFVTSGSSVVAGETESNANRFTADLGLRLGLPWDSQLEIGLPYRRAEVQTVTSVGFTPVTSTTSSGYGLGDLRVGFAKTLLREGLRRPDLVGRITWNTASGKISDNGVSLGGGFHEIQGSLTAIKRQDPMVFIGGLSYQHSFENDQIKSGPVIATNLGGAIALSPESSLRLFLSGAYQGETELFGSDINGSDRTVGSFVIGSSTLLAPGILLNASLGIGLTDDAEDMSLAFSIPIRFDTPLF